LPEEDTIEINRTAVFAGAIVDWASSDLVGYIVIIVLLALKGTKLDDNDPLPADVLLARNIVGVVGAIAGGAVAGWLARRHGGLHGVLSSVLINSVIFCVAFVSTSFALSIGDIGFIVLNLIGAGYAGKQAEQLRDRIESNA